MRQRARDKWGLTARQKEVLSLVVRGYSRREAAAIMGISIETVKTQLRNAYTTIGVETIGGAVRWWTRTQGEIEPRVVALENSSQ